MANKKDPRENLKPFKKGQSGNPGGRPKLPDDIKEARKLNRIELERVLNEFIQLNLEELKERIRDPKAPALEIIIGKIIGEAISKGDHVRFDFLLNRLVGKVTESIEHNFPKPTVITRRDGTQVILGTEEKGD